MLKRSLPAIVGGVVLVGALAVCGINRNSAISSLAIAPASAAPAFNPMYINGKKIKWHAMPDGLKYFDIKVGAGAHPQIGQTVSVQYTGWLLNGTKFDSSYDHGGQPIGFPIGVGQVIKGWDEGVPPMRVGGKRRLMIPGNLAYGPNSPTPAIPPNATLVFDIQLVGVN